MSVTEIRPKVYDQEIDYSEVRPVDDPISKSHPFWHLCRKCAGWVKVSIVAILLNLFIEFVTFIPIHNFFHWIGWM